MFPIKLMSFMVSGPTFKPLTQFEFILVCGIREWSSFILPVSVQFSQYHLLKRLPLTAVKCMFLSPLSEISWPYKGGFMSGLSILFHWCRCPPIDKWIKKMWCRCRYISISIPISIHTRAVQEKNPARNAFIFHSTLAGYFPDSPCIWN